MSGLILGTFKLFNVEDVYKIAKCNYHVGNTLSEGFPKHILEHYKRPKNYGEIKDASIVVRDSNRLCGDYIEIYLKIDGNRISAISFKGQGCMISQAAASILTEFVKDKEVGDVLKLTKNDMTKMLGLQLGPVRVKCAMLPLTALKKGIESYLKSNKSNT